MKKNIAFISILSILAITGCSLNGVKVPEGTDPEKPGEDSGGEVIEETLIKAPDYSYKVRNSKEEFIYEDLFNINNKVDIEIDVDKSELDKIQEDNNRGKKPEIYHLANKVTINITNNNQLFTWELENVGIRQKGNFSRENIFVDGKLNNHNHYKLSFDETFTDTSMYDASFIEQHGNLEYGEREFLGLSGLDFKWNRNDDSTHIKELYSSYMYRSAGIIVQHVGLSNLSINTDGKKTDFGLCFMYEQTSKSLIKRAFKDNKLYVNTPSWNKEKEGTYGVSGSKYGDYYKATYGSGDGANEGADLTVNSVSGKRVGVKTDIYGNNFPAYERKTNTDVDYNDALIKNLVNKLNSGTYEEIGQLVDLEYFAIEEAVSYIIGNPDSFRNNYNNSMLYFRHLDGKMIIIPIDNDRTFGIGHTWDKGITFASSQNNTPFNRKDVNGNTNKNPLIKRILLESGYSNDCQKTYVKYLDAIIKSDWVKNETFTRYFNIAKSVYSNHSFSLEGGNDNISFANYIKTKISNVQSLTSNGN